MPSLEVGELSEKIINIIKKETPEKAIDKICCLKNPNTDKKLGKKVALDIYKCYAVNSVPYIKKLYENNYTEWSLKINANIKRASNHISK